MFLAIDISSSDVSIMIFKNNKSINKWRIYSTENCIKDEYGSTILPLFQYAEVDYIKIDDPRKLGLAIFANAIADNRFYNENCIFITLSIRLAISVVANSKYLLGVLIMPDIQTSFNRLIQNA